MRDTRNFNSTILTPNRSLCYSAAAVQKSPALVSQRALEHRTKQRTRIIEVSTENRFAILKKTFLFSSYRSNLSMDDF